MDQYIDNRHKEILYNLLANPADAGRLHIAILERMVHDDPQSGLLQVLLARAGADDEAKKAAVYYNPGTLHKLLHNADNLPLVAPGRIINIDANGAKSYLNPVVVAEGLADEPKAGQYEQSPDSDIAEVVAPEGIADINQQPGAEVFPGDVEHETAAAQPQYEHQEEGISLVNPEPEGDSAVPADPEPDIARQEESLPIAINLHTEAANAAGEAVPATEIDEEVYEEIRDTENVIPELYQSYQEQLAHPEAEQPAVVAEGPADDIGTVTPELYDADQTQLTAQGEIPEQEDIQPAGIGPGEGATNPGNIRAVPAEDIDEEVYDEIVGIDDIGFINTVNVLHESEEPQQEGDVADEQAWHNTFADDEDYPEDEEEEDERPLQRSAGLTDRDIAIDEEKLILGNIVSADYLTFDKKLDELRISSKGDEPYQAAVAADAVTGPEPVKEQEVVSLYNDDSMPYSFMWWLDKTRKEHAGSFQPYVTGQPAKPANVVSDPGQQPAHQRIKPVKRKAPDELQQQYYENIFSLTSVSGIERDTTKDGIAFDQTRKEDVIIERFIHNEPQIRPPAADRLDNENKAKKSSEDLDALVTETLARIYTDQMLYHKAIATYNKLVLKFPEKKLYFAAQIEQLEKKTI